MGGNKSLNTKQQVSIHNLQQHHKRSDDLQSEYYRNVEGELEKRMLMPEKRSSYGAPARSASVLPSLHARLDRMLMAEKRKCRNC